jgi:hypothetical protein
LELEAIEAEKHLQLMVLGHAASYQV